MVWALAQSFNIFGGGLAKPDLGAWGPGPRELSQHGPGAPECQQVGASTSLSFRLRGFRLPRFQGCMKGAGSVPSGHAARRPASSGCAAPGAACMRVGVIPSSFLGSARRRFLLLRVCGPTGLEAAPRGLGGYPSVGACAAPPVFSARSLVPGAAFSGLPFRGGRRRGPAGSGEQGGWA